jgi:hypothetical protein
MRISIQTLATKTIVSLEVKPSDTIDSITLLEPFGKVRATIQDKDGISCDQPCSVVTGKGPEDGQTLSDSASGTFLFTH